MGFCITDAVNALKDETAWQITPVDLSFEQYKGMIVYGIKRLMIDTGRALAYDDNMLYTQNEKEYFELDLAIDEEEYVFLTAQIQFFRRVQLDSNTAVSYTTNAMSVTQANKPYEHLQDTIEKLEARRRELYYRMVRYALDYAISD